MEVNTYKWFTQTTIMLASRKELYRWGKVSMTLILLCSNRECNAVALLPDYHTAKKFNGKKSDEFDELNTICQKFSLQNFT